MFLTLLLAAPLDLTRGNAAGPGTPSGPVAVLDDSLTSLDFVSGDEGPVVVIGASVMPEVTLDGTTLLLTFEGGSVPPSLERPLDTAWFGAPVRSVVAHTEGNDALVRIELVEVVPYSVQTEGGIVSLSFPSIGPAGQFTLTPRTVGTTLGATGTDRCDLEADEAPIRDVLTAIAAETGWTLRVEPYVQADVTVSLQDVTWMDALVAVVDAAGLQGEAYGVNGVLVY